MRTTAHGMNCKSRRSTRFDTANGSRSPQPGPLGPSLQVPWCSSRPVQKVERVRAKSDKCFGRARRVLVGRWPLRLFSLPVPRIQSAQKFFRFGCEFGRSHPMIALMGVLGAASRRASARAAAASRPRRSALAESPQSLLARCTTGFCALATGLAASVVTSSATTRREDSTSRVRLCNLVAEIMRLVPPVRISLVLLIPPPLPKQCG
jgi:hypothetical protein